MMVVSLRFRTKLEHFIKNHKLFLAIHSKTTNYFRLVYVVVSLFWLCFRSKSTCNSNCWSSLMLFNHPKEILAVGQWPLGLRLAVQAKPLEKSERSERYGPRHACNACGLQARLAIPKVWGHCSAMVGHVWPNGLRPYRPPAALIRGMATGPQAHRPYRCC